ncbi:MAG: MOSC domain-containing protein [Thermoanaerobaculia bacterium]
MPRNEPGRLETIWVKRAHRGVMDPVERATLLAGQGVVGSANQGGRRQVTLIEASAWQAAEKELGATVPPVARRANLLVSGLSLAESRGRLLAVGSTRLRVNGETRPCERMDEAFQGLRAALSPEWRGGCYAEILEGGEIASGDAVAWLEEGTGSTEP